MTEQEYQNIKARYDKARNLRAKILFWKTQIAASMKNADRCDQSGAINDKKTDWNNRIKKGIEKLNEAKKQFAQL